MALRDLMSDVSKSERFSKAGIELRAENFKDGLKYMIKGILARMVGEEKSREMIDAVKANQAYQVARKGAYAVFKGAYKAIDAIGKVATLSFLRPGQRLALPSADHRLKVKDIDQILLDSKNQNFISSEEQLKLVEIAILKYDGASPEAKAVYDEELKKMDLAQQSKYKNKETGEVDVEKLLESGRKWKKRFINQRRGEAIADYTDTRREDVEFKDFSPEQKDAAIKAAIMAFKDPDTEPQFKKLAGAILEEISPATLSAVSVGKDKDGKDKLELRLNEAEVVKVYNEHSLDGRPKAETLKEITDLYEVEESLMANDKLLDIKKNGIKTKEEYEKINEQQKVEKEKQKRKAMRNTRKLVATSRKSREEMGTAVNLRDNPNPEVQKIVEANRMMNEGNQWVVEEAIDRTTAVGQAASKKIEEVAQGKVQVAPETQTKDKSDGGISL